MCGANCTVPPPPHAPRAQRYPLSLPTRFRRVGTTAWQHARTVDVSASGVLVEAIGPLPGPLGDIELVLGVAESVGSRADITCVGRVVRLVARSGGTAFGASIDGYWFSRLTAAGGIRAALYAEAALDAR